MSFTIAARPRRAAAFVAAAALALTGTIAAAPTADAAAQPTVSVTPNPATPGALQTFAVTITGGSVNDVGSAKVTVPASYTSVSFVSLTAGWTNQYDSANQRFSVLVNSNPDKLHDGESITLRFQAQAPAATGATSFAVDTWSNAGFNGSPVFSTTSTVNVGSLPQAISFGTLEAKTFGDADFTVSATGGGSGNAVTFTASGDCTAGGTNGATIHLTGAGSCSVTANQPAGGGYTAAPPVTRTFTIGQASQVITFDAIDTQTYGTGPLTLAAAGGGSGNPVTFTASGACTLDGTSLALDGAGTCTVKANQAGNANYTAAAEVERTFTIAKATATLSLAALNHDYDGNAHAATVTTTPAALDGVSVSYSQNGNPVSTPTAAGSYDVVATLDNANYAAESATGTLVINAKHITGTFTVADRAYDGHTDATVTGRDLVGVVDGDQVTLTGGTATFDSKDVGTRTATLSGATLDGADAANYILDSVATDTGEITPLKVTGTVAASDKTYDGTTVATATGQALAEAIGSDAVTVHVISASFDTKDVGTGKTVTATIALTGADAGNYELASTTTTTTASIWAIQLTGAFIANDKVYDGNTDAVVHAGALAGVLDDEDVTLTATDGSFADKNVGTDKVVTATLALAGADAGNYVLTNAGPATSAADITAKPVTGSFTAANKIWDGTNAATVTGRALATPVSGDDVALSGGTATFSSPNVGTWTVTGTGFALTGADKDNYALASSTLTTTASISALYRGNGFFQPVDMTPAGGPRAYNSIKGGQTVPLKFEIFHAQTGVEQTSLTVFGADAASQASAFKVSPIACTATSIADDVIELVTTGGTSLRYDASDGQYIQNWKTPTGAGTCYAVSVKTLDGTTVGPAYFKITK